MARSLNLAYHVILAVMSAVLLLVAVAIVGVIFLSAI